MKRYRYTLVVGCMMHCFFLSAATWRVFMYMDVSDNLADMAFKNITDIMRVHPNDTVDVKIQVHAYNNVGLRYQVCNENLVFLHEIPLSCDSKQDFIDAASWAFTGTEDAYTMLILSNHGWGAIDPRWNAETKRWEAAEISLSHSGNNECQLPQMPSKNVCHDMHSRHKGFMFNGNTHMYLTNQDLSEGLSYLQKYRGAIIDVLVFDTCMGSMLEIATCVAPYAHYLVGVQTCAMRDGFDYQQGIAILKQSYMPCEVAKLWIKAFDAYYTQHDDTETYTCAALDLHYVKAVNEALNNAVQCLLDNPAYIPLLKQARADSPRFCLWPTYTDLVAFCKNIEQQLAMQPIMDDTTQCIEALHDIYKSVDDMVIARCGGAATYDKAHGFSMYLPWHTIDDVYANSLFAQQSQWIYLLKAICV